MSEQDDLRVRLARLDPAASLDPVASPRAPELLERIMSAPVLPDSEAVAPAPTRKRAVAVWAAAAAALALGSAAAGIALRDDAAPDKAPTTLALKLPASNVMASCVQFDVQFLKGMSPAFGGTAAVVEPGRVVIDVDRWYTGGSADRVELAQPDATSSASLDGVTFEEGKRYLVTASDGTVNGCGFSGPATPQLEASFQEAFGG